MQTVRITWRNQKCDIPLRGHVPSSRHPRLDPGPPLWKGTTHLLRLNSQIYSEARHLLHDKPNRVTLNVFQPFFARKQPLIRACLTEHSSWALRKYTLPQVSRMNDLTIRIPYFEWRGWPEHSLVFGDVLSRFEEMAEGQRRHQSEISRQLYILAAAASHNPHLRRLTLAFRRWKAHQGRDNVDPDAAVYTYLQKALEPLVRFRGRTSIFVQSRTNRRLLKMRISTGSNCWPRGSTLLELTGFAR
jgi:hypothetical protein